MIVSVQGPAMLSDTALHYNNGCLQYAVHGVPKPAETVGLMTPIVGQLPSTAGLEAYLGKHEQETKAFRRHKASHYHYVRSAKCPSGNTPYEKNMVAELQVPSSFRSKNSKDAATLGFPAMSPTIKACNINLDVGLANASTAAAHFANPHLTAIRCTSQGTRYKAQKETSKLPWRPPHPDKRISTKPSAVPFGVALEQLAAANGEARDQQAHHLMDFMKTHISQNWELTSPEMASFVHCMQFSAPVMQVSHMLLGCWSS
jgi:hypothetical protein